MEKFKGTPGPWRVSDDQLSFQHVAHDFYHQISAGCGYLNEREGMGFSLSGPMSIHDASLIAAAPELLGALINMVDVVDDMVQGPPTDAAHAAIKKALGE